MRTGVFVVSDLHLGGAEGFQMCSSTARSRLAELLRWCAARRSPGNDVHVVLAGDVVDFLAEADAGGAWAAFTPEQGEAVAKLDRILEATRPVWDALTDLVAAGAALTILLGNHDIELSLPQVRRRLLERVAPAGGRVSLLYDNEALALGDLLVEHGNRYDPWNAVAHDSLRRLRSRLSRRGDPGSFPAQPGSEVVARVMNPIKRDYAFVDLLKPVASGVLPVLAVLDPGRWRSAGPAIRQAARTLGRLAGLGRSDLEVVEPEGPAAPAAEGGAGSALAGSIGEEAFDLADELCRRATQPEEALETVRGLSVRLLLLALRKGAEKDGGTFRVEEEAERYLEAARGLADRGYRVVVFGHTHRVKRIGLPGGGTYLNTGAWADLMRIPAAVYQGDEEAEEEALRAWLEDLGANRIERYRRLVPTYARVDLDPGGRVLERDVYFFDGPGDPQPVTTEAVLARFSGGGGAP